MPPKRDYLADLTLLRNDAELAARVRELAERGDPQVQFALGLIYAEGRGVAEDLVEAYAWLSLALLQGDRDADRLRWPIPQREINVNPNLEQNPGY